MDHLAAAIGEFDRIEPSAHARFHDRNSPPPRREIELKGAVGEVRLQCPQGTESISGYSEIVPSTA